MNNITVFKTDVENRREARFIKEAILKQIPGSELTFDLDDCDNVLRIENPEENIEEKVISGIFEEFGFQLQILP